MPELENKKPETTPTEKVTEPVVTPTPETPSTTTSEVKSEAKPEEKKVEPATEKSALEELGLPAKTVEPGVESKEGEQKKVEPEVKIEPYELALSAESPLTKEDLAAASEVAKKNKWTKVEAEEYVKGKEDLFNRGITSLKDKAMQVIKEQKDAFLKDPNFQGENLIKSLETINTVVEKYGDQETRDFVRGQGGSSLPLAKMLLKIGNIMKQDTMSGKGAPTKAEPVNDSTAGLKKLYPSFFEETTK